MKLINNSELTSLVKKKVSELGFNICGIARVRALKEYGPGLESWIKAGMHDIMNYLERDIDKRLNPESLLPEARSLIVTGLSYFSEIKQTDPDAPLLSRYTYGTDYHKVISAKLTRLLDLIKSIRPEVEGRAVVDNAPLLEKAWAQEAGLGMQGRHSILINQEIGSFFFIGILILNIDLEYDSPFTRDLCKGCRTCIDACPTEAINNNRTIDARRCIANLTIENRGPIPEEIIPYLGKRVYGCDRCQEVCPWNKKVNPQQTPEFEIGKEIATMSQEQWRNLSKEQFSKLFNNTSMSRIKYEKLMVNIDAALGSLS